MIAWIFLFVVLAVVGKLIYDVQQKKNKPTQMYGFDKDEFQKLAGIKPINENDELRQILLKNNIQGDKIVEELKKEFENSEFPAPDPSINVRTTKIGSIDTNFGDSDPLSAIPMSRVSKEGKQKMAEIAKDDINTQIEKNAEKFEALNVGLKACGCGRSETGFCTGLHKIPKADWANGVREIPTSKKKSNPKQMDGVKSDVPFVKPKRKYTKKPKV
jgi:CDGSH-type Zn-finger protein